MANRRTYLRSVGALALGSTLAGCTSGDGSTEQEDTEAPATTEAEQTTAQPTEKSQPRVEVGPEKRLRYDPETIEITVGETVLWEAMSVGHNVTSHPDASPKCEVPEGAEPFTSYEGDDHFAVMEKGDTFEHEFTVPGEYTYVCTPHSGQGMVGSVIVSE